MRFPGVRSALLVMGFVSACTAGGSDADVTLSVAIRGSGRVTSTPAGLACDGDSCTLTSAPGTTVTLTAAPDAGDVFAGWKGACTGSKATCTLELTSAAGASVSALFVPLSTSLDVAFSGGGTGEVTSKAAGIACTNDDTTRCTAALSPGTSVTLTATPDAGSTFIGWSDGCTGSAKACTTTIGAFIDTVTARFEPASANLIVDLTGQGTVTTTSGDISCSGGDVGTCAASVPYATYETLVATPADGWAFAHWTDACSGLNASQLTCILPVVGPTSVGALFTQLPGTVSAVLAGTGSGQVLATSSACSGGTCFDCPADGCSTTLDVGATVTLTATAQADSRFVGWSGACAGTAPCTVSVDGVTAVTATFDADPEVLTVEVLGDGAGNVTAAGFIDCGTGGSLCSATVPADTPITLTATPSATSRLTRWSGPCVVTGNSCTVSLHDAATVTAEFDILRYTLTVAYPTIYYDAGDTLSAAHSDLWGSVTGEDAGGSNVLACDAFTSTCSVTLPVDSQVTLTGVPVGTASFAWWTEGGTACSGSAPCTVTLTADTYIDAVFAPVPVNALTLSDGGIGEGIAVSIEDTSGATSLGTCANTCTYFVETGTTVDFYGFPPDASSDYIFQDWAGPAFCATPSCGVTVSADTYEVEQFSTVVGAADAD